MDQRAGNRRFVPIAGRRLSVWHAGEGCPAVVMEAGAGDSGDVWEAVFAGLAAFTRVYRYDRAGLGESDPATQPRTLEDMAEDLERLLRVAQVSAPYVLVGHSFGGPIVHLYAQRHPENVAGLVLVDPAHPDSLAYAADVFPGLLANLENIDLETSIGEMRSLGSVGAIPVTVLVAGNRVYPPELPPSVLASLYQLWDDRLRQLSTLSTRGRHILVPDSDHYIHVNRPDVVVDAVRRVVEDVQMHGCPQM